MADTEDRAVEHARMQSEFLHDRIMLADRAVRDLILADTAVGVGGRAYFVARAQVYATLAVAAAVSGG